MINLSSESVYQAALEQVLGGTHKRMGMHDTCLESPEGLRFYGVSMVEAIRARHLAERPSWQNNRSID